MKHSKISNHKIKKILHCFCCDLSATTAAKITGFNRNTINRYYKIFRQAILELGDEERSQYIDGEIELDESYFGPRRVRGKPGRGAGGKVAVFGVLKRYDSTTKESKVYTQIVKNCSKQQLLPIIKGKILEEATIYTDGWSSYDGLITEGYKHHRIYHSKGEFARGKNHVNGIESFWSYCKSRLSKFRGVKNNFPMHLRECEFRFNHKQDLETLLKKKLRIC